MSKSLILSHEQISLKLDRMAWQILEDHYNESKIVLIGLEKQGADVCRRLTERLESNAKGLSIEYTSIKVNKKAPLTSSVELSTSLNIENEAIILVDDVLNSGKTLAAALKKILEYNPKSVRTAVLANRDHHTFPIQANYVGISLATTLKEHISYEAAGENMNIYIS